MSFNPAILVLADGTVFHGEGIGATGHTVGEVVFNTSMTGYQEILTDPSYSRQIVTLTYPHIGNVGVNDEDLESDRVMAAGLVVRDVPLLASNFRMRRTLPEALRDEGVVAIAGIDTRRLTRILRDRGAQAGAIVTAPVGKTPDVAEALALARAFPGLAGMDLAKEVSRRDVVAWHEGEWELGRGYVPAGEGPRHVVVYDYGVKRNILRMIAARGCRVTVVPAQTPFEQTLALAPDGILLANGPGDPAACGYAIASRGAFPPSASAWGTRSWGLPRGRRR